MAYTQAPPPRRGSCFRLHACSKYQKNKSESLQTNRAKQRKTASKGRPSASSSRYSQESRRNLPIKSTLRHEQGDRKSSHLATLNNLFQISPVRRLAKSLGGLNKAVLAYPAIVKGNLFKGGNLQTLILLYYTHEFTSLIKTSNRCPYLTRRSLDEEETPPEIHPPNTFC